MIVDVRIQEGRVVSYAGVEVEGANALSSQEVAAFYPASGGFVDWIRIREADLSVRQKYHDMGFAGVMISGRVLADDSSGLLRYRIRIVEGVQYRVGKVLLPGELASWRADFPSPAAIFFVLACWMSLRRKTVCPRNSFGWTATPPKASWQ